MGHSDLNSLVPSSSANTGNAAPFGATAGGKKHATVNYVFDYSHIASMPYHRLIMERMTARGYKVSPEWLSRLPSLSRAGRGSFNHANLS